MATLLKKKQKNLYSIHQRAKPSSVFTTCSILGQYAIPKINMLCNLCCLKTRLRLLCNKYQQHSSLNLVSQRLKLCNIFIFGMAYCISLEQIIRIARIVCCYLCLLCHHFHRQIQMYLDIFLYSFFIMTFVKVDQRI